MKNKARNRKYTFTGILVIIILVGTYWGLNYLKGNDLFNKQNTYHIVYDRIDGLNVSSPVTINGFKVGQVYNIQMLHQEQGKLLVTIALDGEYILPDSSIARIYSMDLMGTKGIEIILGESNILHEENDTLFASMEQSLRDQVNMQMLPIKNQAEELMKEMESAIAVVKYIFNEETRRNLQNSFASIKRTVEYLESSSMNLDSIVTGQKSRIGKILEYTERITKNISENNDEIANAIQNLSDFSDSLSAIEIASTVNKANQVMNDISIITDKINNGEGSLGMLINNDSLYIELERASVNLDRLVWDIRMNPDRYVNIKIIDFGKDINVVDESMLNEREKRKLEKKRNRLKNQNNNPK